MNFKLTPALYRPLALISLLVSTVSYADTVNLINGDRITGSVDTIAEGALLLTTEHMGAISIPMGQVAGIDKPQDIRITTATGEELMGTLSTQGGTQTITTANGTRVLALANVSAGMDDELARAAAEPTWTTTADVGYILTKGNSQTESRTVHIDSIAQQGKFQHRGYAYWNTDEADEETTRDTFDSGYELRYYFRDKWYALGSIGYFKDELKEIDSRYTLGAGLGYQFFDHSLASLSTDLSVTYVKEDLAGESESNPALRWGVDYFRWIQAEKIEYFYGHEVLKILDSERGEVYKVNTGLRLHLSERWHANARVDLVHETEPPPGNHRSDITYSFGFGMNF